MDNGWNGLLKRIEEANLLDGGICVIRPPRSYRRFLNSWFERFKRQQWPRLSKASGFKVAAQTLHETQGEEGREIDVDQVEMWLEIWTDVDGKLEEFPDL